MSRIGKQPVELPSGVKASVANGRAVIEGPRGKLEYCCAHGVAIAVAGNTIVVTRTGSGKQADANYGTTRAHLANMVAGVTKGWKKSLEFNGVGYTAALAGNKLTVKVGLSHDVVLELPAGMKCKVERNIVELESNDKQQVGNLAATIRKIRPPEPYLGKGIKYTTEVIKRKAGKTAK